GACIFRRGHRLDEPLVTVIKALPYALVDADCDVGARLVKSRIVVVLRDRMQPECHIKPGADPFAPLNPPTLTASTTRPPGTPPPLAPTRRSPSAPGPAMR